MERVVNLAEKRKEAWLRKIEEMREVGGVAVFGAIGEQDAIVIPFPRASEENIPDDAA